MMLSRLASTCRFISASRCWPRASAAVMSCRVWLALCAVLGQEFGGGEEHRAGQAGVGVRAALLDGQPAVAVGQGLGGAAEALFGPGGFGERPGGVESDCAAVDVDLAGGFPVAAHGGVVQSGVVARSSAASRDRGCGARPLGGRRG